MVREVSINNFKSVREANLSLSRFNVLIGSNGSGKSNILEAIAFGGAASADKLDNEFLGSRGIRTSTAQLMKSAFSEKSFSEPIKLIFKNDNEEVSFTIEEQEKPILKWIVKGKANLENLVSNFINSVLDEDLYNSDYHDQISNEEQRVVFDLAQKIKEVAKKEGVEYSHNIIKKVLTNQVTKKLYENKHQSNELTDFIIYSPEISSLRKFEEESQIKPLGIKGEGLFNVLQIFNENYGVETINELKEQLHIIEWFDDFEAVNDNVTGRKSLLVKDRFIPEMPLNQNNVNEGFLFLMFYVSLFVSKETPAFFAIDNIEASFHPRLCEELIKNLIKLGEKHHKQVIFTTHNPFVLDGLNLNDPEQSLFVVRRNADGETIADKITKQPKNIKLSEAWMRGYIGGHPETIE